MNKGWSEGVREGGKMEGGKKKGGGKLLCL